MSKSTHTNDMDRPLDERPPPPTLEQCDMHHYYYRPQGETTVCPYCLKIAWTELIELKKTLRELGFDPLENAPKF